jgi:hypothetical protein
MTMLISHCGWNSMLEATTGGVPMVMCPLHIEQRMNNVVLSEIVWCCAPVCGQAGWCHRRRSRLW